MVTYKQISEKWPAYQLREHTWNPLKTFNSSRQCLPLTSFFGWGKGGSSTTSVVLFVGAWREKKESTVTNILEQGHLYTTLWMILSVCLPDCTSLSCLSFYLTVFLAACHSTHLSACLSIYQPVFLSACHSIFLPASRFPSNAFKAHPPNLVIESIIRQQKYCSLETKNAQNINFAVKIKLNMI